MQRVMIRLRAHLPAHQRRGRGAIFWYTPRKYIGPRAADEVFCEVDEKGGGEEGEGEAEEGGLEKLVAGWAGGGNEGEEG